MFILIIISQSGIWHPCYPESSKNVTHYLVPPITSIAEFGSSKVKCCKCH